MVDCSWEAAVLMNIQAKMETARKGQHEQPLTGLPLFVLFLWSMVPPLVLWFLLLLAVVCLTVGPLNPCFSAFRIFSPSSVGPLALDPIGLGMNQIRRALLSKRACGWIIVLALAIASYNNAVTATTSSQCIDSYVSDGNCDAINNK